MNLLDEVDEALAAYKKEHASLPTRITMGPDAFNKFLGLIRAQQDQRGILVEEELARETAEAAKRPTLVVKVNWDLIGFRLEP